MRRGKRKVILFFLFTLSITSCCGCSIVLPRADTAAASLVETVRREGIQWESKFNYENTEEDIQIKGNGILYTSTPWTVMNGETEIQNKSIDMRQEFKIETQNEKQCRYIYSTYADKWYKDTTNTSNATDMLLQIITEAGKKNGRVTRRTETFNEKQCYYASTTTEKVIPLWQHIFPSLYDSFFKTQPFIEEEYEASYAICFLDKESAEIVGVSLRARTEHEKLVVDLTPRKIGSIEIENMQVSSTSEFTPTDNPLSKDWEITVDETTPLVETPFATPQENDLIKARAYSVYEKVFFFNGKALSIPCTSESVESACLYYADDEDGIIEAGETKSTKYIIGNGDSINLLLTNDKSNRECSYKEATVTGIILYAESLTNTEVIMPGGFLFGDDTEKTGKLFRETPEIVISRDKLYTVMIYNTTTTEYSLSFYAGKLDNIEIMCKTR